MKITFEIDHDILNSEERDQAINILQADKMRIVIQGFEEYLYFSGFKHKDLTEEQETTLREIRQQWLDLTDGLK